MFAEGGSDDNKAETDVDHDDYSGDVCDKADADFMMGIYIAFLLISYTKKIFIFQINCFSIKSLYFCFKQWSNFRNTNVRRIYCFSGIILLKYNV